ncbi:MAG: hypothetical protein OXE05_12430, partial [Chloroflexi bacterium]|nr:hypothetical protein [Chloroflexota bacterium]
MVYLRLALIAALLAVLGTACGADPASESATPPAKAVARQTPTAEPTAPATSPTPTLLANATQVSRAVPTPVPTTIPTPVPAAPLPLGESTLEAVEFFYELPEVVAIVVLAKMFDTAPEDPRLNMWVNELEWRIAASPMVYQMYTWAHYPIGTYPDIEQFMDGYIRNPMAYAQAARDWLDSGPCTWPEEVQAQVVALERESPGWLEATIISVLHAQWMAEPAMEAITIKAKSDYFVDPDAYLDRFRCAGVGGRAVIRTPAAPTPTPVPTPVATATQKPGATPTPVPTTMSTPAPLEPLPLGESTLEVVEFYFEHPEVVAIASIAKMMGVHASHPAVINWTERLAPRIGNSRTIYLIYTWDNYPAGAYPSVEQFMHGYLIDPRAYGEAAKQWLDSGPCAWPEEVQEKVVAVEQASPGRLQASIVHATTAAWAAEPAIRYITLGAREQFYDDREAYLDQFRCTGGGGATASRTQVV